MIAIDPGNTTGFAFFQQGRESPVSFGEVKADDFNKWLRSISDPKLWVVEDYIIRPGTANQWNKGDTLKLIGRIELYTDILGANLVMQQPSIKPLGYGHAGMEYVKGKSGMHIYDAIAHGAFYRAKNGW